MVKQTCDGQKRKVCNVNSIKKKMEDFLLTSFE